jgi:hypothetical protein
VSYFLISYISSMLYKYLTRGVEQSGSSLGS